MQQLAQDEAGHIWEVDAQGNPLRLHQAATAAPSGQVLSLPPSAKDAVQIDATRTSTQRAQQGIGLDAAAEQRARENAARDQQKFVADLYAKGLRMGPNGPEPIPGWVDPTKGRDTPETAKSRADALAGYQSAQQLETIIADLKTKYAAGPGITSGIRGLADYLPYDENKQFDNAGNAARGIVGSAMGFTGGQLNTATEAAAAVGPFLPQSSDRDAVIRDKIKRLEGLRDMARKRAIAQLGGVPDMNGNVTAVATPQEVASGTTRTERDPKASAMIDSMIRAGASPEQINAALTPMGFPPVDGAKVSAAREYLKRNPGYKGSFGEATRTLPNSALNRASASPVAGFVTGAANGLTAGFADEIWGGMDSALTGKPLDQAINEANLNKQAIGDANWKSSLAGNFAGSTATMLAGGAGAARLGLNSVLGRGAPIAGDLAIGALSGAGESNDNRLLGAGIGTFGAGTGRMAFSGLTRAGGRALRGVTNPEVRYLAGRGVPLTLGRAVGESGPIGAAIRSVEERVGGFPIVGPQVRERQRDALAGFNRAAFDDALAPINATTDGQIGSHGVDAARAARSAEYNRVLDPVTVQADATFVRDMRMALRAGRDLPEPMRGSMEYTLPTRVGQSFSGNGSLAGRDYQQALRGLRRDAKSMENLPYGHDFGQVTRQAEGALEGLLDRQSPGTAAGLRAANAANRNVEIVRGAVHRARNGTRSGEVGMFMPSQLADEAAANGRRMGGTHGTTAQPFLGLTQAGQRILPSTIPDSGTAGRLATLGALGGVGAVGGGVGAGVGGAEDAKTGAGASLTLAAILAAGASRPAQRALVAAALRRPQWLINAGNSTIQNARLGGMFGRTLGTTLAIQ